MNKSEELGKVGEDYTLSRIKQTKMYTQSPRLLRNVYIPNKNGCTEEADIVFITRKGIIVFENKNYSDRIFGDENDQKWTQKIYSQTKQFTNPIRQNQTHISWLKDFLEQDVFCYSVIVFAKRCKLKKITVRSKNTIVIKSDGLIAELDRLEQELPDILTEECAEQIYQKLLPHSGENVSESVKEKHLDRVQIGFQHSKENPNNRICPRCGAELVLRTAKKGANAGKQFYGCSAFSKSKCRYTQDIEQS